VSFGPTYDDHGRRSPRLRPTRGILEKTFRRCASVDLKLSLLSLLLSSLLSSSARSSCDVKLYSSSSTSRLSISTDLPTRGIVNTYNECTYLLCVCGTVGTRSALEELRLYLGCVRLCALQIDIYIYIYIRKSCSSKTRNKKNKRKRKKRHHNVSDA